MITRRTALGTGGVALLGGLAGCAQSLPFLSGGPIEFSASPAVVSDAALQETGYAEYRRQRPTLEQTYEVGGQTQDVVVNSKLVEYDKAIDLSESPLPGEGRLQATVFSVMTTPKVDVLGRSFNPLADVTIDEYAAMVQDRYEGLANLSKVGERMAPVAGQETTVGVYDVDAELIENGLSVRLRMYIAETVEFGEDLIVASGGYPRLLDSFEEDDLFTMMAAIEHESQ